MTIIPKGTPSVWNMYPKEVGSMDALYFEGELRKQLERTVEENLELIGEARDPLDLLHAFIGDGQAGQFGGVGMGGTENYRCSMLSTPSTRGFFYCRA